MTTQQSQDLWNQMDQEALDHPEVIEEPAEFIDADWRYGFE
jgi:hypothetical protein